MARSNSRTPVCRGLDLGFGFTKFSTSNIDANDELRVDVFPSYAGPAADMQGFGTTGFGSTNIITVKVGNEVFSVGPDARLAAEGMGRQILETSFFKSAQYLALAKGAMAMMNVPEEGEIDSLVLGLPLNVFRDQSIQQHIVTSIKGKHEIPVVDGQAGERTRTITVKEVSVIPQVLGSLVYLAQSSATKIDDRQNLTIDVGYGTLLWLVSNGMRPLPGRSNGNMGGASSLLQTVLKAIDPSAASNLTLLERLDTALREGQKTFMVSGEEVTIAKYREKLVNAANDNLTEMLRTVGQMADIDNIFLTGGGAHLYYDLLKEKWPSRKIIYSKDGARFQNVRGFQALAEADFN